MKTKKKRVHGNPAARTTKDEKKVNFPHAPGSTVLVGWKKDRRIYYARVVAVHTRSRRVTVAFEGNKHVRVSMDVIRDGTA